VKVRIIAVSGVMRRKSLQFSSVNLFLALTCIIYEQKERLRNLRASLQVMEIRLYDYMTFKD